MKIEIKKVQINDGLDVYRFLCDLGNGENGFIMKPPRNKEEFKNLLTKYINDSYEEQPFGRVPQEIYWMYVNDIIVGIIKVRPKLNEALSVNGGNLGYSISPSYRGNGYGKLIVQKGLEILKLKGVSKVLVTIYEDNIPSRKSVEKNNGELYDINNKLCRYLITNY